MNSNDDEISSTASGFISSPRAAGSSSSAQTNGASGVRQEPRSFFSALEKLEKGGHLQRTLLQVFGDMVNAEDFLIKTLSETRPEDFGRISSLDNVYFKVISLALECTEIPPPGKRKKPEETNEGIERDDDAPKAKKTELQPGFPITNSLLDTAALTSNQQTWENLSSSNKGDGSFAVQMPGFLSVKSALKICEKLIIGRLTDSGMHEGIDFSINGNRGSVTIHRDLPNDSKEAVDTQMLKLITAVSFDISQLITFSTVVNRPAPNNFKWSVVAQMVANRNISEATGQNAYSQALEKELKQATKALPASSWSSPRPRTQAYAPRQRNGWRRSRNSNGQNRWNGGGNGHGGGGGYGQGRGRGRGGARGGGSGRDAAGAGGQ